MQPGSAYYYDVDGSRVELDPADEVAVDLGVATEAGLRDRVDEAIGHRGRELRGDLVLLGAGDLPVDLGHELDEAGALQPVFRADDGTLIVVLPEIRIEAANRGQASRIRTSLKTSPVASEVVRDEGDQLVVRPASRRGADALELANRIAESVEPPLAQPRFLRVVPRPAVTPPTKKTARNRGSQTRKVR